MITARALRSSKAFTIIEVLVVVVTLAILATITLVAYDAAIKNADETSLKSDLKTAADALELHKFESSDKKYPSDIADIDVHPSGGNTYNYSYNSYTNNYCLSITSPNLEGVEYFVSSQDQTPSTEPCGDLGAQETSAACFAFNSSTGAITSYYHYEGNNSANPSCPRDVIIPREIDGVTVTSLAGFDMKSITSVSIPNSVVTISSSAFAFNSISSLTIPNSVKTIGTSAFFKNNISSLKLPSSITSLGTLPFNDNKLPEDKAFIYHRNPDGSEDKTRLKSYAGQKKSGITMPSNITSIEPYAFHYSGIVSVVIGPSVSSIGAYGFSQNNLTSLTFENTSRSVTIGEYAFQHSSTLSPVTLPNCSSYIPSGTSRSFHSAVTVNAPCAPN